MTRSYKFVTVVLTLLLPLLMLPSSALSNDDEEVIRELVQTFLAGSDKVEQHRRFWAKELVYTSSDGSRTNRERILEGFATGTEKPSLSTTSYRGEELNIQLYGTTAVVTFRLVGTPSDGSAELHYYNTGTLLKREGEWRAVAWQATRIPSGG